MLNRNCVCAIEIQTEVETAAEAGRSTERSLCPARPRPGSSPAQRTIVSNSASTILMSWFVLLQSAAVAIVFRYDWHCSLKSEAQTTWACEEQGEEVTGVGNTESLTFLPPALPPDCFGSYLPLICMAVGFSCVSPEFGSSDVNQTFRSTCLLTDSLVPFPACQVSRVF